MLARVPRFPFSLDPLIAEAKRRARRRRTLIALAVVALAALVTVAFVLRAGAGAGARPALAAPSSGSQGVTPTGPAARRYLCGDAGNASGRGGCHSPDNRWSIIVNGGAKGDACTLTLISTSTGRHEVIHLPGSGGCARALWVGHTFLIQEGYDNPGGRVVSLNPPDRSVKVVGRFVDSVVSPNGRWLAGDFPWRLAGWPQHVAVVSLDSGACHLVTQVRAPDRSVSVDKSPWSFRTGPLPGARPTAQVTWRTILQGHVKVRVASGPAVGFIRDSRGVIVGVWDMAKTKPYLTHMHRRQFALSTLRTPCPAGLVPHG
ncbi:MAG: hypothetical protein C5B48_10115 [Candidatus Rokuibacteriota bacterium]|nr:MAG: hypothetical protein C5B48_10115 [Candidatus Rokubacteria bacterium]